MDEAFIVPETAKVAPDGTVIVSPDVPISRAVPLWGSSLSTFNTDAIVYPCACLAVQASLTACVQTTLAIACTSASSFANSA